MNWNRLAGLVFVIVVCALAWWGIFTAMGWAKTVQAPPARYDYEPTRAYSVSYDDRASFALPAPFGCGPRPASNIWGCAYPEMSTCIIYIRADLTPEQRQKTLRHEKAHCNGWHKSHPR